MYSLCMFEKITVNPFELYNMHKNGGLHYTELAAMFGVSVPCIRSHIDHLETALEENLVKYGDPDHIINLYVRGSTYYKLLHRESKFRSIAQLCKMEPEELMCIETLGEDKATRLIQEAKTYYKLHKSQELSQRFNMFDTSKKYDIIYADPPWSYRDNGMPGGAEQHYPTMDIEDIYNLPVNEIASDNCILFIWVTFPLLKEGIKCIEEWGFTYKTIGFNWVKHNKNSMSWFIGTGSWTRSNSEICLIGVKGKPTRVNMGIGSVIDTPIEAHSKKPDIVRRKIVELVGDKPRIELFARQRYKGWDAWGNELPNQ